ncbi:MAG: hypothetical protein IRY94_17600 [Rhodospirillaceae bacterium]|nr:hypothetical protein [Rhodospirillaceae bacterium]
MCKFALLLGALAVPVASAANAGAPCSSRKDVLSQLSQKYKEAPVAVGLATNGNLIEVLTAADGATWTIIQTSPAGMSCLVAAGESWQQQKPQVALTGDPAI